jgi:hypothetical protein
MKPEVVKKAIPLQTPVSSFDAHATRISTRSMFTVKEEVQDERQGGKRERRGGGGRERDRL